MLHNPLLYTLKDVHNTPKTNYTAMSVFSGGGGSSIGYKLAGFDVIGNVEIDPYQNGNYIRNLNPKYNFNCDIRELLNMDDWELPTELYDLDILDGSPPCTLFSGANREADIRKGVAYNCTEGGVCQVIDDLPSVFCNLAIKLQPKVVIFENVKGLSFKKNKHYVDDVYRILNKGGYQVAHKILNAKFMGVPQTRDRFILIAVRNDLDVAEWDISLMLDTIESDTITNFSVVNRDFKGVGVSPNEYTLLNEYEPSDKNMGYIHKRLGNGWKSYGVTFYKPNQPAYTLRSKNDSIDPINKIRLSDYELCQVQSFPTDYDFGTRGGIYTLGMSVPPFMIKRIADVVKEEILDKEVKYVAY